MVSAEPARISETTRDLKGSVGDAELAIALRRLLLNVHRFNLRERRTRSAPFDHGVDRVRLSFEHGLHAPVGHVARVSPEAELPGARRALRSEEDSLHPSRHED